MIDPRASTEQDRIIGQRIQEMRKLKGVSQAILGEALGVSFQQVQKYEKGRNRVSAHRMQQIADFLRVPVASFFSDSEIAASGSGADILNTVGALDLLRAYARIESPEMRSSLITIAAGLAPAATLPSPPASRA